MNLRSLIPVGFQMGSRISPFLAGKIAWELFCRPRRLPRPAEESEFWGSGQRIRFASGRVARSWGQGPLIFFLHGWESRGSVFSKMIPQVVAAGYQAMAWDGPAHGDSPGSRTNMPNYAFCLNEDLGLAGLVPKGLVGHSLGGAAIGVYMQLAPAPTCAVFIAAPSSIQGIFERYCDLIRLPQRARQALVKVAEREIGFTIRQLSLVSLNLDQKTKIFCLHDEGDKEIPYLDFQDLQSHWPRAQFKGTKSLGHRRIVKDAAVASMIVEFLRANISPS